MEYRVFSQATFRLWIKSLRAGGHSMKGTEQFLHILLIVSHEELNFEFVFETLLCDHSNETSSAVLPYRIVYLVCSSNF